MGACVDFRMSGDPSRRRSMGMWVGGGGRPFLDTGCLSVANYITVVALVSIVLQAAFFDLAYRISHARIRGGRILKLRAA